MGFVRKYRIGSTISFTSKDDKIELRVREIGGRSDDRTARLAVRGISDISELFLSLGIGDVHLKNGDIKVGITGKETPPSYVPIFCHASDAYIIDHNY